jgi:putative ABC transport system ATP-binding protein
MLRIEGISKIFGKGSINEKLALDDLSLSVEKGDFITIIGSNGAGKSTLMSCISGVYGVDSGKIYLDGADITKLPEYKRSRSIGRVFQDPLKGTAFDMTIEENLAIAASKRKRVGLQPGLSKKERDIFREKLALLDMGLENRMKQKSKLLWEDSGRHSPCSWRSSPNRSCCFWMSTQLPLIPAQQRKYWR